MKLHILKASLASDQQVRHHLLFAKDINIYITSFDIFLFYILTLLHLFLYTSFCICLHLFHMISLKPTYSPSAGKPQAGSSLSLGVKRLDFFGRLCLELKPLLDTWPIVGHLVSLVSLGSLGILNDHLPKI